MKHLAAYCLLVLGGNQSPSERDVAKLLKEVGVAADAEELATAVKKLSERSVPEHIAAGSKKMGAVGGGSAAAAAPAGGAPAAAEAAPEAKKEEEPEEEEA